MLHIHLPIFSRHLPTSRRQLSRPTAVGRCVLIPLTNAESNVESVLDKDISSISCDKSDDKLTGVCWFFIT